jgi:hypothetical protein
MTKKIHLSNHFKELPQYLKNFVKSINPDSKAFYSDYYTMEERIRYILKEEYGVISFRENYNGWYDSDDLEFATEEDYIRFVLTWSSVS